MAKKVTTWKTKGMNQDLSVSAFSSDFSFENVNLRLSTNEDNTQLSWVSERSPMQMKMVPPIGVISEYPDNLFSWDVTEITGTVIGTATINHTMVLFSTIERSGGETEDFIYALKFLNKSDNISARLIYSGNLGFSVDYPIETLVSYESELIQKVYWTDGKNQPRMINIVKDVSDNYYKDTSFDFINEIQLNETVKVQKLLGASGIFSPGVIQYAFTYFNKYGQETNIFNVTPLYYISHIDRGASPDETAVENAFRITIENPDISFDYLRIYSIQRTSLNDVPFVKRIQDISLKDVAEGGTVSYLDVGTTGDTVDPMSLLYKGGETIIAETLEQKNNTLFLGNLSIPKKRVENVSRSDIETAKTQRKITLEEASRDIYPTEVSTGAYEYSNQLTSYDSLSKEKSVPCNGFMMGEMYRLGMQFQHKTGKWSDPIWIDDKEMENTNFEVGSNKISLPIFKCTLKQSYAKSFINADYKRVRAVAVFPNIQDRNIICQGVACPTLCTETHRDIDKDIYAQSSWFFRTGKEPDSTAVNGSIDGTTGTVYPRRFGFLKYNDKGLAEGSPVPGDLAYNPSNIKMVEIEGAYKPENQYKIDSGSATFHSPDIEFDTQLSVVDYQNFVYDQVGYAHFDKTLSDILIQTETPTISSEGGGFIHKSFTADSSFGIVAGLFYDDYIIDEDKKDDDDYKKFGV